MEKVAVRRWKSGRESAEWDVVLEEAPLEIRVSASFKAQRFLKTLAITMRTPGHDEDLATGLLFSEGIIKSHDEITLIHRAGDGALIVDLAPWADVDWTAFDRSLPLLTSSCGVCGKKELPKMSDAIEASTARIKPKTFASLEAELEAVQASFTETGGSHAAAWFDAEGNLKRFREDVGRHNALDKLIGSLLKDGSLPLADSILFMTSRASYDILQKAIMAGIPIVAAAGAPSTAAIELAERRNLTLIGFLRGDRFNVYTGSWRVG
ncbi:sulfurtransferase FdhD [Bryobacterales bacterium F-183]|nr:sulfurtransferase FdhD [Bryobacterales bacterium F-183]